MDEEQYYNGENMKLKEDVKRKLSSLKMELDDMHKVDKFSRDPLWYAQTNEIDGQIDALEWVLIESRLDAIEKKLMEIGDWGRVFKETHDEKKFTQITYIINNVEKERIDRWKTAQKGNDFSYIFTPTGIGCGVAIRNNDTKKEHNVTDYDSW